MKTGDQNNLSRNQLEAVIKDLLKNITVTQLFYSGHMQEAITQISPT